MVFALATPVLVGGAGLAVETSFDYLTHTRLQSAADAAAFAAGLETMAGSDATTVRAAAIQQATQNGWSGAGNLTINTPPASGPNAGLANAVEVQITQNVPRFFTALFSQTPVTAGSRSVVITQTASNACVLALDKTAPKALQITGNTTVTLNGCDIMSDSIANNGVNIWGSSTIKTDCAVSAGGVTNNGGLTMTGCQSAVTQAARIPDPLSGLATPSPGQARNVPAGNNKNGLTLQPGSYAGGMDLKGPVTLMPGTYYVSNGFSVEAGANVSGSGVTIYLTSGSNVTMNGNASVNLTAPSSGTYSGILFFGARGGSGSNTFNGDASSHMTGNLYFPSEDVTYLGNFSGTNGCTHIIADTVTWSGSTTLAVDCSAAGMGKIPARLSVKLVE